MPLQIQLRALTVQGLPDNLVRACLFKVPAGSKKITLIQVWIVSARSEDFYCHDSIVVPRAELTPALWRYYHTHESALLVLYDRYGHIGTSGDASDPATESA